MNPLKKLTILNLALFSIYLSAQDITQEELEFLKNNPELIENISDIDIDDVSLPDTNVPQDDEIIENVDFEIENNESIFGLNYISGIENSLLSSVADLPVPNDYRISLGDKLRIVLTGSQQDIITTQVELDGSILLPNLGSLNIFGDTLSEVRIKIKELVSLSYVGSQVSVSLTELEAKKINIIGAVLNPGVYVVSPFTTITYALAYAGGLEEYGSLRNIEIIKTNGKREVFDMYDLLIFGDRSKDYVVQAGDTINVKGTSNYIQISGSVIRPMTYEYKSSDTYADLLDFALGLTSSANKNALTITYEEGQRLLNKKAETRYKVGELSLKEFFIGSKALVEDKDVFVTGNGVSTGYYSFEDLSLAGLVNSLSFSSDIYPFYAVYEKSENYGLSKSRKVFSLADKQSYSDFELSKNSRIIFYDRNFILKLINEEVVNDDFKEAIIESDNVFISMPNNSFSVPLAGNITPQQIHSFFGIANDVELKSVSLVTQNDSFTDAYNMVIQSSDVVSISFPQLASDIISITVEGEVYNGGVFQVASGTTLEDIYKLTGGFRDSSFQEGIIISREEVLLKEMEAIKKAKTILAESIIQQSVNIPQQGMIDIQSFINLADAVQPTGRISGDFSPDSMLSKNFILQDGDSIFIPKKSSFITVQGEVLNPSSFAFNDDLKLKDYIDLAGGYGKFADRKSIFIIRANGESVKMPKNIFAGNNVTILEGDTILVPRTLDTLNGLPMIQTATRIIADIAFSAASLNALKN